MYNAYVVDGDEVTIFLQRRNAPPLQTVIDLADFALADAIPGTWCAQFAPNTSSYYVIFGCSRSRRPARRMKLHRLIMSAPSNMVVDHLNHDTLDNRRKNLKVTTNSENLSTARRKNPGKHVYLHKPTGRWYGRSKNIAGSMPKFTDTRYFRTEAEASAALQSLQLQM